MKSATIRQIRHELSAVLELVADGQTVVITNRGLPVAHLVPPPAKKKTIKWPDFAARRRKIFGHNRPIMSAEQERKFWEFLRGER